MGFEKFKIIRENVAVEEQAETQALMNQALQRLQQEQATPVEEGLLDAKQPEPQIAGEEEELEESA